LGELARRLQVVSERMLSDGLKELEEPPAGVRRRT